MPNIHRIRYVNFMYGKAMIIRDKTFDLAGEHMLFNLINGGGKTSMIHMLAQAVVPNTAFNHRPLGLYFKGEPRTTHVMIEWKLDNNSGYLLSGFCATGGHEKMDHWFSYHHHYLYKNPMSLDEIPVLVDGQVMGYGAFRTRLNQERQKNGVQIFVYSDDQKRAFKADLLQFGIYADEWEEHLRMNMSETQGLNQHFEKLKTSADLMKKEIILRISAKIQKTNPLSDHQDSLVKHYALLNRLPKIEEELQDLRQMTPLLDNWLDRCIEYDDAEKGVKQAELTLASFRLGVTLELEKINKKIAQTDEVINQLAERLNETDYKLDSFRLYEINKKIYMYDRQIIDLVEAIDNANEEASLLCKKIDLAKAVDAIAILSECERKVAEVKAQQESFSKDNEEKYQELTETGGCLKSGAKHLLAASKTRMKALEVQTHDCDTEISRIKKETDTAVETINELNKEIGRLEEKIAHFQRWVSAEVENRFTPIEFMRLESSPAAFITELRTQQSRLSQDLSKVNEATKTTTGAKKDLENKINGTKDTINENKILLNTKATYCTRHENAEAAILKRLTVFTANPAELYDGTTARILITHRQKCKEREIEIQNELNSLIPELGRIAGDFYLSSDNIQKLVDELLRVGVSEAISGSEYLQGNTDPKNLLCRYPALPYAVVVNRESLVKLGKRNQSLKIEVPGLLISRDSLSLDIPFSEENSFIITLGPDNFAVRPDDFKYYLSKEDYLKMKERLLYRKTALEEDAITSRKEQEHYLSIETAVSEFVATNPIDIYVSAKSQVSSLTVQISELEHIVKSAETEQEKLTEKLKELEEGKKILIEQIQSIEQLVLLVTRYQEGAQNRDADNSKLEDVKQQHEMQIINLSVLQKALSGKEQLKIELRQSMLNEEEKQKEPNRIISLVAEYSRDVPCKDPELLDLSTLMGTWSGLKTTYESGNIDRARISYELAQAEEERRKNEGVFIAIGITRSEAEAGSPQPRFVQDQWATSRSKMLKQIQELRVDKGRLEGERKSPKEEAEKLSKKIKKSYNKPPIVYFRHIDSIESFTQEKQRIEAAIDEAKKNRDILDTSQTGLDAARKILSREVLPPTNTPREIILATVTADTDTLKENRNTAVSVRDSLATKVRSAAASISRYTQISASGSVAELIRRFGGTEEDIFDLEWAERTAREFGQIMHDEARSLEMQKAAIDSERQEIVENLAKWVHIFFDEIPQLVNCSRATIQGRSRTLLSITLNMTSLSSGNIAIITDRLSNYLNQVICDLDKSYGDSGDEVKLSQDIANYLAPYPILDNTIDIGEAKVEVWKAEVDQLDSRMVPWEEGQSGAQGLLASFIVYISMLSYISKGSDGKIPHTRTVIADNPFATLNAGYILNILFELFDRNKSQLIAFTGHEDHEIYRRFPRINLLNPTRASNGRYVVMQTDELKKGSGAVVLQEAKLTGTKYLTYSLFDREGGT